MENNKSKFKQRFKLICISLITFFSFVYIAGKTGYYENHLQKNTLLTSEAILEFEKDIAEGKEVDIKDYINADIIDYRNQYSKLGYNVSKQIDFLLTEGVSKVTDFLKTLFS